MSDNTTPRAAPAASQPDERRAALPQNPERQPGRVGLVLCAIVAAYFLISPIYAVFHFHDFASATPQFLRYVIAPGLIAAVLLAVGWFASPPRSAMIGLCCLSILG